MNNLTAKSKLRDLFKEVSEEALQYGLRHKVIIYVQEKNNKMHFADYEPVYDKQLNPDDFETVEEYNNYVNELMNHKNIDNTFNVVYNDELYIESDFINLFSIIMDMIGLKISQRELVLIKLERAFDDSEIALMLGLDKAEVNNIATGLREFNNSEKKVIDDLLGKRNWEQRTELVFDESDI